MVIVKKSEIAKLFVVIIVMMLILYLTSVIITPPYTIMAMGIVLLSMLSVFFMITYDK